MNQPRSGQAPDTAWQIQTLADSAKRLAERGDTRDAEGVYRQILEIAPYHIRALNFLAVQTMLRGELDASQGYLEQALRAAPERPILHKNLAIVLQARGELEKSLAAVDRAIALRPDLSVAYLHRGDMLDTLGRKDEALLAYWQAWRGIPNPEMLTGEEMVPPVLRGLLIRAAESLRGAQSQLMMDGLAPVIERHGKQALQRVLDAVDVHLGLVRNPHQHALQRPTFIFLPGLTPQAFFDRAEFPWVKRLEAATGAIKEELSTVLASGEGLRPYVEVPEGIDAQQWKVLNGSPAWSILQFSKGGTRNQDNRKRCPKTTAALDALPMPELPGHAPEAMYSILKPGTDVPPHFGLGNYKLAVHLPLQVPRDCAIRVGNETRSWVEGECLIFDDSFQHEAWNRSDEDCAVLLVEVWNPAVTEAEREGITVLVEAIAAFNTKYRPAA
ncbi:MAG TPA: aspartyl/asparaginyl beta-hydroxylase domain-containing protein [Gammaproteobacteria bacterium]